MPAFSPSSILRTLSSRKQIPRDAVVALAHSTTDWSKTLALPRSQFPPLPNSEQLETYRTRCADDLYTWQRVNRPARKTESACNASEVDFVLHDGPPYANGAVHVGHALNKVLKDLILRWELSKGKRVRYVPGWDCHGLPIELKALQKLADPTKTAKRSGDRPAHDAKAILNAAGSLSPTAIREAARGLAAATVEIQKRSFREWGVMGEWDTPYKTMDKEFEIRQLGVFREMVRKGLISRHYRPVYWSPSSRSALAEAELEYDDHHKCTAAFVKFPFVQLPKILRDCSAVRPSSIAALIWTTTPWTIPANRAIAVKDDMKYSVIEAKTVGDSDRPTDQLVVGSSRVDYILSHLPDNVEATVILDSILGSQLVDGTSSCYNLFSGSESPILSANFVTATSGTGLVHMAPGHGMEDYQVCQQNDIRDAFAPVDDAGRYTSDAFPSGRPSDQFEGLDVQTSGVQAVLKVLSNPDPYLPSQISVNGGLLLAEHDFVHKNPVDWRTKQPVITRATAQWFADVSAIRPRALAALEHVTFIPDSGKTRLRSFIEGRSQWCISRQRAWGVPIPALYHVVTGEACITDESIDHIIATISHKGIDAWFSDNPMDDSWVHPGLERGKWIRGKDTMDVWFDSGTTWTNLESNLTNTELSDVYLEGTDQHRGWFQSSLLTNIATQDTSDKPVAPFKVLATHGFTLDGQGRKMSKSLGNVISAEDLMSGSLVPTKPHSDGKAQKRKKTRQSPTGPDLLRLWVASSDYTRDVSISQAVLQTTQQALQKYRVTFKFLLGVLKDYPHTKPDDRLSQELSFADRAVLSRYHSTCTTVYEAYGQYKFYAGISEINKFINNDLSAFYFEVVKDTLYAGELQRRRHTQTILFTVLQGLLKMLGPATPLLVEEVWEWMPPQLKGSSEGDVDLDLHPLRQVWDPPAPAPDGSTIEAQLDAFKTLSSAVKVAQEKARDDGRLGSGLACRVAVNINDTQQRLHGITWLQNEQLSGLLVVSGVEISFGSAKKPGDAQSLRTTTPAALEWSYEQAFEFEWNGERVAGNLAVLPPGSAKCVRCWKYTVEDETTLCGRCQTVLVESL